VVVHVDAEVLADAGAPGQSALEDGARVPAGTSQRLACDASRVVMRHGRDGRVVEVDARTRTIPPAIRRALHHRDRGCRFPGCGVRFGQGHHIRHWAHGGPTTLSNLALLCTAMPSWSGERLDVGARDRRHASSGAAGVERPHVLRLKTVAISILHWAGGARAGCDQRSSSRACVSSRACPAPSEGKARG
jgi:hypothetical protein